MHARRGENGLSACGSAVRKAAKNNKIGRLDGRLRFSFASVDADAKRQFRFDAGVQGSWKLAVWRRKPVARCLLLESYV